MKTSELLAKKDKDLMKELADLTEKLQRSRMDVHLKKQKNYKELGRTKRDIARIRTVLSERKIIHAESKTVETAETSKRVSE